MNGMRNDYGFPVDDCCEYETWREEMSADEAETFDALRERVHRLIDGSLNEADIDWVFEETLYQIKVLVKSGALCTLPGVGRIALDYDLIQEGKVTK